MADDYGLPRDAMKLVRLTEDFCERRDIFGKGLGVVVACSGGVDSLSLADMFFRIGKRRGAFFVIAHFEHGIRGEASKADARFVEDWAKARRIPFFFRAADVPQLAKEQRLSVETAARNLRYEFLRDVAREINGRYIATAHHADDQAETVLMHLLRGSGLNGLSGMSADNGEIIRPLLTFTKAQLINYAVTANLSPRTDATNFLPEATRNKLRLELLPLLTRDYNPNIVATLTRLAEQLADERDFIGAETEKIWPQLIRNTDSGEVGLVRKKFATLPVALQRTALRRFFAERAQVFDIEFVHTEAVRRLIIEGHSGNVLHLPRGIRAEIVRRLFFLR